MNHSPRDGKSPTVVWRWRWKAFGVFFFRKEMMSWQQHCDWVGDSKLDCRPCTVFFSVRITINKPCFFSSRRGVNNVSNKTGAFRWFFRDILEVDKNSTTVCGKKGFLQFKRGTKVTEKLIWSKRIHSFFTSLSTGESGKTRWSRSIEVFFWFLEMLCLCGIKWMAWASTQRIVVGKVQWVT